MANYKTIAIPVTIAQDTWFLSQSCNTGATATTFSVDGGALYPQRIALSSDHTGTLAVTLVYTTPWGEPYTDAITVAASSTVTYSTYPCAKLTSVKYPTQSGVTLKVGFQGYPYYWVGDFNHNQIVGAVFYPLYAAVAAATGDYQDVTIATAGTPAANKVGYDSSSRTLHYCYPTDGSGNAEGGILYVNCLY